MIETIEPLETETCLEKRIDIIMDRYGANRQFSLAILHDIQKRVQFPAARSVEPTHDLQLLKRRYAG